MFPRIKDTQCEGLGFRDTTSNDGESNEKEMEDEMGTKVM